MNYMTSFKKCKEVKILHFRRRFWFWPQLKQNEAHSMRNAGILQDRVQHQGRAQSRQGWGRKGASRGSELNLPPPTSPILGFKAAPKPELGTGDQQPNPSGLRSRKGSQKDQRRLGKPSREVWFFRLFILFSGPLPAGDPRAMKARAGEAFFIPIPTLVFSLANSQPESLCLGFTTSRKALSHTPVWMACASPCSYKALYGRSIDGGSPIDLPHGSVLVWTLALDIHFVLPFPYRSSC